MSDLIRKHNASPANLDSALCAAVADIGRGVVPWTVAQEAFGPMAGALCRRLHRDGLISGSPDSIWLTEEGLRRADDYWHCVELFRGDGS
jgi:hypothetical protein